MKRNERMERAHARTRLIFIGFAIVTVLYVAIESYPAAHAQPAPATPRVNVNAATLAQLMYLPGVGAKTAAAITDYRAQHGQFRKVSDLLQVKGIGEKKLAKMAAYVSVSGPTTAGAKIHVGGAK